jgi:hypothetical protein
LLTFSPDSGQLKHSARRPERRERGPRPGVPRLPDWATGQAQAPGLFLTAAGHEKTARQRGKFEIGQHDMGGWVPIVAVRQNLPEDLAVYLLSALTGSATGRNCG